MTTGVGSESGGSHTDAPVRGILVRNVTDCEVAALVHEHACAFANPLRRVPHHRGDARPAFSARPHEEARTSRVARIINIEDSTATQSSQATMLIRSHTPIYGVGRFAWSCGACIDVTTPAPTTITIVTME